MTQPTSSALSTDGSEPFLTTQYNTLRTDVLALSPGWMAHRYTSGGRWHWAAPNFYYTAIGSPYALDYIWATPILIGPSSSLTGFGLVVTAGVAGNARMAIYADNGSCYPGDMVYEAPAPFDVTGAGAKTTTFAAQTLASGLYWLAYVSDVGPSINYLPGYCKLGILGTTTLTTDVSGLVQVAWAYQAPPNAMPDPFTGGGTLNSAAPPALAIQLS